METEGRLDGWSEGGLGIKRNSGIEAERQCAKNRNEWRALVQM